MLLLLSAFDVGRYLISCFGRRILKVRLWCLFRPRVQHLCRYGLAKTEHDAQLYIRPVSSYWYSVFSRVFPGRISWEFNRRQRPWASTPVWRCTSCRL